uniref:PPFIA binding protein 2 n=1 Tax=Sinocyclocheilus grahami TaxID=75366 RepID=A0A672Q950_SINGR
MASDASHMLEAALEQMDDIIAGSKAAVEFSNGLYDLGSPVSVGLLPVLQLAEELRLALELQARDEDRNSLRSQLPCTTAQRLMEWLEKGSVNLQCSSNNETYQERLARLEVDKESLVLQVSVLTDQVEAQGEKIRDLESSLEEHNHKLISTEEMLQQELLSRTSLETQKLELMDEVSYLKLKLVGMEEEHNHIDEQQKHHKAEALLQELRLLKSKVEELEGEKSQYERKLKATKDRHIEELNLLLGQYRKLKDVASDTLLSGSSEEDLSGNQKIKALTHKAYSDIARSELQVPFKVLNGSYHSKTCRAKFKFYPSGFDCIMKTCDIGYYSFFFTIIFGLFHRIRRTQSGSLPADSPDSDFKRGGFRATAGPRLTCLGTGASARDRNAPFSKWSCDQVCAWMEEFGLGQYVNMARQWVTSGQTLLSASSQDFEKELGIKHLLHRKKLQLALCSFSTKITEKSSELDHIWVTRWLDDIGLPQYKDQFSEGRVDGRMLQYLTVNDLLFLKVSNQLHHLSIKCAIHVLHVNKFNPNCLKRRPGDENKTSPSEVVQWSNHRVMEWLRSVDLAEYAPNLRGSGVHGGLIILEPRFNSDTLAMLLNIPPQKTLLRRHLATNFNTLMGSQAQQEKQEYLESSGYTPLTTTAKVRPRKIGFSSFGHRKKRSDDSTDYICPLDASQAQALLNGASRPYSGFRGLSPIFDRDPERRVQVGALQI